MYEETSKNVTLSLPLTGMGFITFIVFLILKVTGTWPDITWFWVFFPLWIGFAIGFVFYIFIVILALIISRL